jgi:hypothetical protein
LRTFRSRRSSMTSKRWLTTADFNGSHSCGWPPPPAWRARV